MISKTCPKDGATMVQCSVDQRHDDAQIWNVVTYACSNQACGHAEQVKEPKRKMTWAEADKHFEF